MKKAAPEHKKKRQPIADQSTTKFHHVKPKVSHAIMQRLPEEDGCPATLKAAIKIKAVMPPVLS